MILIKNGLVKTMAGEDIPCGQVLLDGDKIVAVGKEVQAPANAQVIDAAGCLVTPGLVEAHCHTGLREDGIKIEGEDVNEFPQDPIGPQVRTIDAINPMDRAFEEAIEYGVTTATITTGSRNVMGGQGVAMKTYGKRIDNMIIKFPVCVKTAFGENTKSTYGAYHKSPSSRLGIAALLRETLFKAREYQQAVDAANGDKSKMPRFDMKLDALLPVMRREIPLKCHAHRADDIFTAIRIANEFNLKMTMEHCTEGYMIVDELKKEGKPAIIGPGLGARSKYELKNSTWKNAKILAENGIKIAIMTDAPVVPLKYLAMSAGQAIKYGLDEQTAWKAITINAAEIVGIAERVGSLEPGKDADVVIFKGNPVIEMNCQTVMTIINGQIVYKNEELA